MENILILDVEDIKTHVQGKNFAIQMNPMQSIIFTRAAMDELISDYKSAVEQDRFIDEEVSDT